MIEQERLKTDPCLCIRLPGAQPLLYGILSRLFTSKLQDGNFKIRHITQFLRSADMEKDALANLEVLAELLPFSLFTEPDYQIQYYYDSKPAPASLYLAFPYYILSGDTLLLLSSDGQLALPCSGPATVRHFQFLFDEASRIAAPLIEPGSSSIEYSGRLPEADASNITVRTIGYQPCLVTFLTEAEMKRYARNDLPDREVLIQSLLLRSRQSSASGMRSCIFSKAGLLDFAATGIMAGLPEAYALPLSVPDRILILKRMYACMETEQQAFYMGNPVSFPLPARLTCVIRGNTGVEFCYYSPELMKFKHIHIQEHSILDTFEDFFLYALQKPLVYSRDETMLEVEKCIGGLEKMG